MKLSPAVHCSYKTDKEDGAACLTMYLVYNMCGVGDGMNKILKQKAVNRRWTQIHADKSKA